MARVLWMDSMVLPDAERASRMTIVDVAVVGAGPAGLAAASVCAEHGLAVTLYDEQRAPGGQVYRGITTSPLARPEILGDEYWEGAALVRMFAQSGARYVPDAAIWSIVPRAGGTFALCVVTGAETRLAGKANASAAGRVAGDVGASATDTDAGANARAVFEVEARAVIIATGAHERPFPIPGWTLPGVHTAGAAQILLKTGGIVPRGHTVLAGSGPLLWLVAWQFLRAGVAIDALLDTTPPGRRVQALRRDPAFVWSPYFARGRTLVRDVRQQVRVVESASKLAIEGAGRAQSIRYIASGATASLPVDQVLLHQGVVPEFHLAHAAGCALAWNEQNACFEPVTDLWGGSTIPGLYIAGDGGGIAGALAAEARGRLAALAVANAVGRIDSARRDRAARAHRRTLMQALRGRRFLDVLCRPDDTLRIPTGATIACRCEEVTAEAIALLARSGCAGPNQLKAYLRCGMGPCQGRFCGLTVTEIMAREQLRRPADVGYFRLRFPAKPITVAELAAMPITPEAEAVVVRGAVAQGQATR